MAMSYAGLDINGDGVYHILKEWNINSDFYRPLPYLTTLVVLAFTSQSSRAPKAEGVSHSHDKDAG